MTELKSKVAQRILEEPRNWKIIEYEDNQRGTQETIMPRHMAEIFALIAANAQDWRECIEKFRDPFEPIGDTRQLATEAQLRLVNALDDLLEYFE